MRGADGGAARLSMIMRAVQDRSSSRAPWSVFHHRSDVRARSAPIFSSVESSPPRRPTFRDGRHRDDDAFLRAIKREKRAKAMEPKPPSRRNTRRTPRRGRDRHHRRADEAQEEAERARRDAARGSTPSAVSYTRVDADEEMEAEQGVARRGVAAAASSETAHQQRARILSSRRATQLQDVALLSLESQLNDTAPSWTN